MIYTYTAQVSYIYCNFNLSEEVKSIKYFWDINFLAIATFYIKT